MSLLSVTITASQNTAPKLRALIDTLNPKENKAFFNDLADDFEILTSEHITRASRTRHTTATRLGAKPTGYLERAASTVEARGSKGLVTLTIQGDIFKRAFGPVTVTAKRAKMLTIPWSAKALGRRAAEFPGLFVFTSKRGSVFLAQRINKSKIEFLFLLKKSVTLPQDRGLLPSDEDFLNAAEIAAQRHVDAVLARLTS